MSDKEHFLSKIEQNILEKINKNFPDELSKNASKYIKFGTQEKKRNEKVLKLTKSEKYNLNLHQEYELKKHNISTGFMLHFVSFASVNIMLMVIWFITGGLQGIHPWFLYALLGWGTGLTAHYFAYKSRLRELDILYANREDYEESSKAGKKSIFSGKKYPNAEVQVIPENLSEPYRSYVRETAVVYESLMRQLNESEKVDGELLRQIKDSLNHYTDKIFYLSKRGQFLDQAMEQFNSERIARSKKSIEELLEDQNLDQEIRKEYESATRMLDRQASSLNKLQKVKDKILANLSTSIITLNTLKLNFIKLQYITDESAESAIQSLNKKVEEIDDYIEILGESLKEIDNQM